MGKQLYFLALLFTFTFASAQNDIKARLEFEEAEKAFMEENYETALKHLDQAEKQLGKWTPLTSYLKIECLFALTDMGEFNAPTMQSLYEEVVQYMAHMGKLKSSDVPMEKYKVVYGIEKTIKAMKLEERQVPGFLQAKKEQDAKNYDLAIPLYEKLVQMDNSWALRNLGLIFEIQGQNEQAMEHYLKAVDKGNAQAAIDLCRLDVEGGKNEARAWYKKAADLGHPYGYYGMGRYALDLDENYKKGMEYFQRAADLGESYGLFGIGYLYDVGKNGIAQDFKKAMEWYLKAADKKNTFAMRNIGLMYQYAEGVTKDYSGAAQWYLKAVDNGGGHAYQYLGNLYSLADNGQPKKALEYYEKSAGAGYSQGMLKAADLYFFGTDGIAMDYAKAARYYEEYYRIEGENEVYLNNLIEIYNRGGHGIEKDKEKSKYWKNIRKQ